MNRASAILTSIGVILLLVLVGGWFSTYTLTEWETAVVIEFGELQGEPVKAPGLHFKLPYQRVQRYDQRLQRWDGEETSTITADRKTVKVDLTARWRIKGARTFREAVGTIRRADVRLRGIITGAAKDEVAKHDLYEVVRSSNRVVQAGEKTAEAVQKAAGENGEDGPTTQESAPGEEVDVKKVVTLARELPELETTAQGDFRSGRRVVLQSILEEVRDRVKNVGLGIHIEDILIKQLSYTDQIEKNVYQQMNSELKKIASGIRSRGRERAEQRLGEMERQLSRIESKAKQRVQEIRGDAEAKAIKIYADAYGKNVDFYKFLRGLEAHEKLLRGNSTLVVGTDTPLYRLLGDLEEAAPVPEQGASAAESLEAKAARRAEAAAEDN